MLALNPAAPIFSVFLLPYGSRLFQAIDDVLASLECFLTMPCRYNDEDDDIADIHQSDAMNDING